MTAEGLRHNTRRGDFLEGFNCFWLKCGKPISGVQPSVYRIFLFAGFLHSKSLSETDIGRFAVVPPGIVSAEIDVILLCQDEPQPKASTGFRL